MSGLVLAVGQNPTVGTSQHLQKGQLLPSTHLAIHCKSHHLLTFSQPSKLLWKAGWGPSRSPHPSGVFRLALVASDFLDFCLAYAYITQVLIWYISLRNTEAKKKNKEIWEILQATHNYHYKFKKKKKIFLKSIHTVCFNVYADQCFKPFLFFWYAYIFFQCIKLARYIFVLFQL